MTYENNTDSRIYLLYTQEKEGSLLEMDEDSQSILSIIKDTTSHSLLSSKFALISPPPPPIDKSPYFENFCAQPPFSDRVIQWIR